ncbi:MAG: hypothetical protein LBO20_05925 [Bifidobacteriaceae bacterium]|nr:hypothetical protein [Bifidobacteriaceae bacterium]
MGENTGGVPAAQDFTRLPDDTPLGPYRALMALPDPGFESFVEQQVAETDKREALTASCMKKAGFDYHPVPYAGSMTESMNPGLARAYYLFVPVLDPSREAVAEWGYGVDSDTDEGIFAGQNPEVVESAAKNEQYLASLGSSAQRAFWEAMYGPGFDSEENRGKNVEGCAGEAERQVPYTGDTPPVASFKERYWDLLIEIVDVTRWDVGMDTRAAELDREWAECAVGKGIDFSGWTFSRVTPNGVEQPLTDVSMLNRPSPGNAIDLARGLDAEGKPISGEEPGLLRGHPPQIEVALADYDCRRQTDYMARIMEIQRQVEQAFVDENRAQLEELMAAAR